jgi:hypothetical protein
LKIAITTANQITAPASTTFPPERIPSTPLMKA